jgi:hypothetical protein
LIKQRLEEMIIPPVSQEYLHRRISEAFGYRKSTKAAADYDHLWVII